MNTQGPIVTTIPESKRADNFDISNLVSRTSDLSYRALPWHGTMESESSNLRGNGSFKNDEHENNFKIEKVRRKKSVIWNHKDSDLIHVDTNHTD